VLIGQGKDGMRRVWRGKEMLCKEGGVTYACLGAHCHSVVTMVLSFAFRLAWGVTRGCVGVGDVAVSGGRWGMWRWWWW